MIIGAESNLSLDNSFNKIDKLEINSTSLKCFNSFAGVSNVVSFGDDYIGGKCTDYAWSCNNPYGDCGEDGAAYDDCVIVCSYSRNWVYCDGGEDPAEN